MSQWHAKVPSLKEVNFGKVKLWAVEHFWTDFDLTKRRDSKMDQIQAQLNLLIFDLFKHFQYETMVINDFKLDFDLNKSSRVFKTIIFC